MILSFKLSKSGAKLNLIFIESFALKFSSTKYLNFGVVTSTLLQLDNLYSNQSLLSTLILYFVAHKNQLDGINSRTDEVVHLHFHSSFGSIVIGHGSLSFSSNVVKETIGILKNTAIF